MSTCHVGILGPLREFVPDAPSSGVGAATCSHLCFARFFLLCC